MGVLHGLHIRRRLGHAATVIMAFLLVVLIDNEVQSDDRMLFENVYRCNEFARAVSTGKQGPKDRPLFLQRNVTAYCVPKLVAISTLLFK